MPSQRRIRLLFLAVVAGVVLTLFYTSHLRASEHKDSRTIQDFYHKTVNALEHKKSAGQAVLDTKTGKDVGHAPSDRDADGDVDDDDKKMAQDMLERLKAAELKAKDLANKKSPLKPDPPSEVVGVGSSAGGQHKDKPKVVGASDDTGVQKPTVENDIRAELSEEAREVDAVLNTILKKSPVIIFSKTYCQYSKRAKGLLLEKYLIEPTPYVVELDVHPMGKQLQSRLADMTGRKTVPNIMVNGVSIGGSDDLAEMDTNKALASKFKELGSGKVTIKERFVKSETIHAPEAKGHHKGHGGAGHNHDDV